MGSIPDFGKALFGLGMESGCTLQFNDFLICNCGTPDSKTFSCTANAVLNDQPRAVTIDLDRSVLDQLIMHCSPSMAMGITDGLQSQSPSGWMLPFDEPVTVAISGRLGEMQRARNGEEFVPIIAAEIKGQNGYQPVSAALALVAIGREGGPLFAGTVEDAAVE